jgi:nucleoside-diphosphate-sugar epimerase
MAESLVQRDTVVLTGSSGLIGTRLWAALVPDYRVFGLDVKPPSAPELRETWIECDLTDDCSTQAALEQVRRRAGERIASAVHLAAYYDFSGAPSPLYRTLTIEGTRRLLRGLRECRTEQLVFSSSLLVVRPAEHEDETLTESSPTEASWDYPRSKLEAEAVIERERGAIPAVVLRIAGVYDEDGHSPPLAQHIWRIREKRLESYFFPGDADHGQPFVHLEDLIACLRRVIELRRRLSRHEVFLIAEPELLSHAALQDQLGELLHGREWPTLRVPKLVARGGAWLRERLADEKDETFIKPWMIDLADAHYPVQIGRARERLGWEPRHRLARVLPEMIARLERDPRGWYARNQLPESDART